MGAARVLLALGTFQSFLGVALALVASAPAGPFVPVAHVLLLASGLAFVALAVALSVSPLFTGREVVGASFAWPALVGLLVGDALLLGVGASWGVGVALVLAAGVFGASLLRGAPLASREEASTHRVGDRVGAAGVVAGVAGLVGAGVLLVAAPRGLPVAGLAVLIVGAVLPLLGGVLALLVPRLSGVALPGATILGTALALLASGAAFLAVSFAFPSLGGFRNAAAGILLGEVLALVAFLRVRLSPSAAQARPLLRGAAVLAPLAGVALLLGLLGDAPNELLPLAVYAHLAFAGLLAVGALALAAPFLGLAPSPRLGRLKVGAALVIAGLFLLAPSFQYPRGTFPGALVMVIGALMVAWPFVPRRDGVAAASSGGRRQRRQPRR